jgi:hypothetical protein
MQPRITHDAIGYFKCKAIRFGSRLRVRPGAKAVAIKEVVYLGTLKESKGERQVICDMVLNSHNPLHLSFGFGREVFSSCSMNQMLFQFTTQNLKEVLMQPTNLDISQTTSRWMLSGYM